jgi:hypothetical protein
MLGFQPKVYASGIGAFMTRRTAVLGCLLSLATATTALDKGSIRVVVIDESGNPVHLAQVMASDIEPTPPGVVVVDIGAVPWFETDGAGQVVLKGLVVGHRYKVYAKKEEEGYADPTIPTYNPKDEAAVVVASDAPRSSPDVRIQLGLRAVMLEYELKDAVTGNAIKDYTLTVTRLDTDYTFGGVNAENRVLIPADTDMRIEFEVKGYQPWYYSDQNSKDAATPLRGWAGEVKHLAVLLQRDRAQP